ncbi:hypothetical protein AOLI_G00036130 [Acnodon oligacanthus]
MQELEKNINKEHLKYWQDKLYGSYVKLFMPKFSISTCFSLVDTLEEMGIVNAFSSSADFSGISEETNQKVSKIYRSFTSHRFMTSTQVLHQAILKVDEKGTEAAAVSTSFKVPYSVPPTMILNRPFLVFIVEDSTKSILFMGKITNPTA